MSEYYDAEEENNLALLESLSESSSEVSRQSHQLRAYVIVQSFIKYICPYKQTFGMSN